MPRPKQHTGYRGGRPPGQRTPAGTKVRPPRRETRPASARRPQGEERPPADTIEGWNPVMEALRAGRPISKLLVAEDVGRHSAVAEILGRAKAEGVVIERVERRVIDRLSLTGLSQGILAMTAAKAYSDLAGILEAARRKAEPALLVILDGIVDPQNLGAVIRTAEAAGAHGVVIPERRAVGLTAAVARASAGAVEHMPVARVSNLSSTIARLASENVWTVGLHPEAPQDYTAIDYRQATAVVVGAEGKGLSRLVKERCDLLASIPMKGKVASLNASVAAALALYEALRQRRGQAPAPGRPQPAKEAD